MELNGAYLSDVKGMYRNTMMMHVVQMVLAILLAGELVRGCVTWEA